MQQISPCHCKLPNYSNALSSSCKLCIDRENRSFTPTPTFNPLNPESIQRSHPKISYAAYMKTIKLMRKEKPSSGPFLPENIKLKRLKISASSAINSPQSSLPEVCSPIPSQSPPKFSAVKSQKSQLELCQSAKSPISIFHNHTHFSRVAKSDFLQHLPQSPNVHEHPAASKSDFQYYSNEFLQIGHKNSVTSIAFIQGRAFTAGNDYKVICWPRLDFKYQPHGIHIEPYIIKIAHSHCINALEQIHGRLLASCGNEPRLKFWAFSRDFKIIHSINTHESTVNTLLSTPNQLLSGGSEGAIKLWDLETKILLKSYPEHLRRISRISSLSPSTFLSASLDSTVKLIDLRATRSVYSFGHSGNVASVIAWDNKSFFAAADKLMKWDLRSSKVVASYESGEVCDMENVNGRLVTGGKELKVWNDGIAGRIGRVSGVKCVKYNFSSDVLYVGCRDSNVIVISIKALNARLLK